METEKISIRPYSHKQLAAMYGVSTRTLRRWLTPFKTYIGVRHGHFYMIPQVEVIFEKLGIPYLTDINFGKS